MLYDFTTDTFGVGNPNFAGGQMLFGVAQHYGLGALTFTNAVSDAQYDNLQFGVNAVPEPATLVLLGTGLLAAGLKRRRHGRPS